MAIRKSGMTRAAPISLPRDMLPQMPDLCRFSASASRLLSPWQKHSPTPRSISPTVSLDSSNCGLYHVFHRGSWICTACIVVQNTPRWHKNYHELKTLEYRLFLSPLPTPKQTLPQNSSVINPLLGRLLEPGNLHSRRKGAQSLSGCGHTAVTPPFTLCRAHLSFLKVICFPISAVPPPLCPTRESFSKVSFSPFPSPIWMVYKPQILTASLNHIFLWTPPCVCE